MCISSLKLALQVASSCISWGCFSVPIPVSKQGGAYCSLNRDRTLDQKLEKGGGGGGCYGQSGDQLKHGCIREGPRNTPLTATNHVFPQQYKN